jgi:hypothetical protein
MINEYVIFERTQIEKDAFEKTNFSITTTPTLSSPDFDKKQFLYSFAFKHSLTIVLIQKDGKGNKFTISFMSTR